MAAHIRRSGVRAFNYPEGRPYEVGPLSAFDVTFPAFTAALTAHSDRLQAEFPGFTFGPMEISSDTLSVLQPTFTCELTAVAGSIGTLQAAFPTFSIGGEFEIGTILQVEFPAFTAGLTATQVVPFTLAVQWPSFIFAGTALPASADTNTNYVVWVVNSVTKAHSTYTNWNANSFARFNGKDMIATSTGIHELTAGADGATAVTGKVYWPPSAFGTDKQQRIEAVYVRLRGSAQPFLLVATCDEQERRIYTASMTGFPAGIHPKRVLFTRNLRGNLWQIGFENTNGGDFDLVEVEVITIPDPHRRLK